MIELTKPGTPQELMLEHHGVLGMRWGHRKSTAVRTANARANARFISKNPTPGDRARSIRKARGNVQKQVIDYSNTKRGPKKAQLKKVYLNNPDRATALRFTRGEKFLAVGLSLAVPPAAPGIAGYAATSVLMRRHIEKKQAAGGYK